MTVLQFKRHDLVEEIIENLTDPSDDVVEALVIGKKKSGATFSFMTEVANIPELIGYLETIKTDLVLEMITQAERGDE
jgi:DNA-binding ferritin-like protein